VADLLREAWIDRLAHVMIETDSPERIQDLAFQDDFNAEMGLLAEAHFSDQVTLMSGPGAPLRLAMFAVFQRAQELRAQDEG